MDGKYIDLTDKLFWLSAGHIIFNPLFWNITARNEYKNRTLTKIFCGHGKVAVYFLACVIFSIGMARDYLFKIAVDAQPQLDFGETYNFYAFCAGAVLYAIGTILVLSSTYQLGIMGTYLGDYFGFLLPEKVTGFPFNITSSPMYDGSTINFLGHSIMNRSPAGLVLTFLVFVVYKVACIFEE